MIQRIQSVYLFLVFCLMAVLVFYPFSTMTAAFNGGFYFGYFSAIAIFALITIFLYKNRNMQIKLCYGIVAAMVFIYAFYFIFDPQSLPLTEFFQHTRFTFVFPLIAIIFLFLAIRGIRKDEKLVRSLDRLR